MRLEYRDQRMNDGARLFATIQDSISWGELQQHLEQLQGLEVLEFVSDGVVESWLDFSYFGQQFSIHDPMGEYWVFVRDPACASFILWELMTHLRKWRPAP